MIKAVVVILNYNGSALLRKFLPGVVAHSAPFSVVVADNGSTDGSADIVAKEFPSVTLIRISRAMSDMAWVITSVLLVPAACACAAGGANQPDGPDQAT